MTVLLWVSQQVGLMVETMDRMLADEMVEKWGRLTVHRSDNMMVSLTAV
jgi:hypothetical protein